jgi:hypothetical protein
MSNSEVARYGRFFLPADFFAPLIFFLLAFFFPDLGCSLITESSF